MISYESFKYYPHIRIKVNSRSAENITNGDLI